MKRQNNMHMAAIKAIVLNKETTIRGGLIARK